MEEATELLDRIKNKGVLPMFTSCCPSWVKFTEIFYPEMCPTCDHPKAYFEVLEENY